MTATMTYELLADGDSVHNPTAVPLRWPRQPGRTSTVRSDLGWFLDPWPGVPAAAVDLVRFAAGAYLADRLTPRGRTFTRRLHLAVAVTDLPRWQDGAAEDLAVLLQWLTGDQWQLTALPDSTPPTASPSAASAPSTASTASPAPGAAADPAGYGPVSLLSGGLDSFLGAVHLLHNSPAVTFLGHRDAATAVRGAQAQVGRWLSDAFTPVPSYTRLTLRQPGRVVEPSSRSRSLLFTALGAAAAASRGATVLQVPENGYTSINLPLHPNRGGALSTRSTHPETFRRLNLLLAQLSLDVHATNPFQAMTKGEAMRQVAAAAPPNGWLDAAAGTLSCSKLDGGRIRGGNPNYNCGLCVPCLVRRGTFLAADQPDRTLYLTDTLTGSGLADLIGRRRSDIAAVRYATAAGVDDDQIDAGTWPPGHDLDATADLVRRGLAQLAAVPLP
jgi:hypothetical protein